MEFLPLNQREWCLKWNSGFYILSCSQSIDMQVSGFATVAKCHLLCECTTILCVDNRVKVQHTIFVLIFNIYVHLVLCVLEFSFSISQAKM